MSTAGVRDGEPPGGLSFLAVGSGDRLAQIPAETFSPSCAPDPAA